ncbi:hypothetical protein EV702DRAFT_1282506 [Suillus placidus]|uniref:HNH nuclease domain-containing protein n=1 Tax=Suillus placidus TaxID=48579 RepID=A0A9P6ZIP5_9AGAM|nr:hypothetical protein EV702DRAFT_1282506 [Suillus placidus]
MSLSEDDSDRDPESSYADSIHKDHDDSDIATPSPVQESSQDEYTVTPTKNETSSIIYSTPTSRSGYTERCSPKTRLEFQKCEDDEVQIAHVIPLATKGSTFKLYEYCLGLEYKNLHVNSRSNLFNLTPTWHSRFDKNAWFLLPDAQTLGDVHHHVKAAIKWRQNPNSKGIKPLRSKLETLTKYTFIPVSFDGFIARQQEQVFHQYPYPNLPFLECHILPPYAVINAGQKLCRNQVDGIVRGLHAEQTTEFAELKQRLALLCDIWDLFMGAQDAAKATHQAIANRTYDWKASIKQWIVESTRASPSVDSNLPPDHYTCTSFVTPPEKC